MQHSLFLPPRNSPLACSCFFFFSLPHAHVCFAAPFCAQLLPTPWLHLELWRRSSGTHSSPFLLVSYITGLLLPSAPQTVLSGRHTHTHTHTHSLSLSLYLLLQTWENPDAKDDHTGENGDNDPIDICDLSDKVCTCATKVFFLALPLCPTSLCVFCYFDHTFCRLQRLARSGRSRFLVSWP